MFTISLLQRLASGIPGLAARRQPRAVAGRKRPASQPKLEALEGRQLLSGAYNITDLGTLGGIDSSPTGLNDRGQEVGWSYVSGNVFQNAFIASHGRMTALGSLLGGDSFATGINNHGDIVGTTSSANGDNTDIFLDLAGKLRVIGHINYPANLGINDRDQVIGFSTTSGGNAELWSNGRLTDLGSLKGLGSVALGINDRGTVVGYSDITPEIVSPILDPPGTIGLPIAPITPATEHPFEYRNGHMIDLGTLGGTSAEATAINNRGTIVGWADTSGNLTERAFIETNGKMTDLGSLGGFQSGATAVNDRGQVVGWSFVVGNSKVEPFLYSNGTMVDLNSLLPANSGITINTAVAINNKGQIGAIGSTSGSAEVAVLLTPVHKVA
jgi:probable HAF family extracellular repeat protein